MNQWSQYGYQPTGDVAAMLQNANTNQQGQNAAYAYGRQYDQEEHEKALQQQEQQRRQYDSETTRMGQTQKFNVLGNLLGGVRTTRYG